MSVSSTRVRTCTRLRSAILSSTVAAADVAGRGGDDLAALDVLGDDRAGDRRADVGVVHAGSGRSPRSPGRRTTSARALATASSGLLVLLLGDRLRLEQLVAPALLRLGVLEPGLGDLELGLGLRHGVPRRALVDLNQQLAPLARPGRSRRPSQGPRPRPSTSPRPPCPAGRCRRPAPRPQWPGARPGPPGRRRCATSSCRRPARSSRARLGCRRISCASPSGVVALDLAVLQVHLAAGVGGDVVFVGDQHDRLAFGVELLEQRAGSPRWSSSRGYRSARRRAGCWGCSPAPGRWPRAAAGRRRARWAGGDIRSASPTRLSGCLRRHPPLLARHAGIDHRQLHVLERRGPRQEVEGLEDEPDLLVADPGELIVVELGSPGSR